MDNEKLMYETIIKYNKNDIKIKITDKKITLEKLKGIINKKYKIIDTIYIDDINMIDNKPQIFNYNEIVQLETKNKTYKFTCKNNNHSKKLMNEVRKFKMGFNVLDIAVYKINKASKKIVEVNEAIGAVISASATMIGPFMKNRKKIANAVKKIKKITK